MICPNASMSMICLTRSANAIASRGDFCGRAPTSSRIMSPLLVDLSSYREPYPHAALRAHQLDTEPLVEPPRVPIWAPRDVRRAAARVAVLLVAVLAHAAMSR